MRLRGAGGYLPKATLQKPTGSHRADGGAKVRGQTDSKGLRKHPGWAGTKRPLRHTPPQPCKRDPKVGAQGTSEQLNKLSISKHLTIPEFFDGTTAPWQLQRRGSFALHHCCLPWACLSSGSQSVVPGPAASPDRNADSQVLLKPANSASLERDSDICALTSLSWGSLHETLENHSVRDSR